MGVLVQLYFRNLTTAIFCENASRLCAYRFAAFWAQDHFVAWGLCFLGIYCMKNIVFPNNGFVQTSVPESSIENLTREIDTVDYATSPTIDHSHVGVVSREYRIVTPSARNEVVQLLMPCVDTYCESNHISVEDRQLTLADTWVNFQSRGEYMIPHTHRGVFSFALWIRVPFTQEEEQAWRETNGKPSGALHSFAFHYTDSLGRITPYELAVDRSWERTMIVFPCEMTHSVTPFYSTDDVRIVVSGNVDYVR